MWTLQQRCPDEVVQICSLACSCYLIFLFCLSLFVFPMIASFLHIKVKCGDAFILKLLISGVSAINYCS